MKELEDKDGTAKFEQKYKLEGLSESTREEKLHQRRSCIIGVGIVVCRLTEVEADW